MMFEQVQRLFKPEPTPSLPVNESAWANNSASFSIRDFAQYNPDALIGRQGFGIYRKMMTDEQVKAVVKFRRDAITSRDWFFEILSDELEDEELEDRMALMGSIIEQMEKPKFTDAINNIMSATYNGFSMTEKTFKQIEWSDKTWWGIKRLRLKPYDTFYFSTDQFGELVKITQKAQGKEQEVAPAHFIHFVQNPDVDENYGRSELREAYRPWFSKEGAWKWRMIWLERCAGGFKWLSPKEGQTLSPNSSVFTALQAFLERATVGSSGILPSGVEMHFEWPPNIVAFGETIKDCDLAIAKALLVPNLLGVTPEVGVGSQARAETQLDAFMWTLDADAGRLEQALNDEVFEPLGEINFGGDPREWPRFRFKPLSDDAKREVITMWKDLVGANVVTNSDADEDHVRDMMDFPKRQEDLEPDEDPEAIDPSQQDEDNPEPGSPTPPPETIAGRGGKLEIAHKRKMGRESRIEFQVIGRRSEELIGEGTSRVTAVIDGIVRQTMTQIGDVLGEGRVTEESDGNPDAADALDALSVKSADKQKLRKTLRASLQAAWSMGVRHAESEMERARNTPFSASASRLKFIREEFFDTRSFITTGKLIDDVTAVIHSVILQAAKAGKTVDEIKKTLVRSLTARGLIGESVVRDLLGEMPRDVKTPNARLETTIRTTIFEAINEARFTTFTDPDLDGFVEAFEYTAILDSRTTQVCEHMDGRIYRTDSEVWAGPTSWRPPNHFNCRSLLIPVTKSETFTESNRPTIFPQEGFS